MSPFSQPLPFSRHAKWHFCVQHNSSPLPFGYNSQPSVGRISLSLGYKFTQNSKSSPFLWFFPPQASFPLWLFSRPQPGKMTLFPPRFEPVHSPLAVGTTSLASATPRDFLSPCFSKPILSHFFFAANYLGIQHYRNQNPLDLPILAVSAGYPFLELFLPLAPNIFLFTRRSPEIFQFRFLCVPRILIYPPLPVLFSSCA